MYGAPSPEALLHAFLFYIAGPLAALIGVIVLCRYRKFLYASLLALPFFVFYSWTFLEWNPATSSMRTPINLQILDTRGFPVKDAQLDVTQFRMGDEQLLGHTQSITRTDRTGHASIPSSWQLWTSVTIKAPGFRHMRLDLDRGFKRFPNRSVSVTWPVLPKNEKRYRSNMGNISSTLPRESDYIISLTIPNEVDEDDIIKAFNESSLAEAAKSAIAR